MPLDRADRNSSALSHKQEAAFLAPLVLTLPTLAVTLGLTAAIQASARAERSVTLTGLEPGTSVHLKTDAPT